MTRRKVGEVLTMNSTSTDSEATEETAARWFARQQSGTWTDADQTQFDAWLEAATAHRIEYIRVITAWNHLACMRALGAGVPPGTIPPRRSWGHIRFFRKASPETHPPPACVDSLNLQSAADRRALA